MKRILMFLMIGLFMFSFASALDFDNRKTFDKDVGDYGRATITNALGFGAKIMEIDLLENTEVCINNFCEARGTVKIYQEAKLIDELEFRESKTNKELSKNIKNSQIRIKDGEVWKVYDGEVLKPGTYEWSISGEINQGQTSDWVGVWAGREVKEWAIWTSEYNLRILASSVTEAQLEINNVVVTDEGSGVWKVNTTESNYEIARAQVMKTLFYGTNGTDPRVVSGITTLTALVVIDERDVGKQGFFAWENATADGTKTFTFDAVIENENVSSWSYLNAPVDIGGVANIKWALPSATNLNIVTQQGLSDETGTNRKADETDNPADLSFRRDGTSNVGVNTTSRAYWLSAENGTWDSVPTNFTNFLDTHGIPKFISSPNVTINSPVDKLNITGNENVTFNVSMSSVFNGLSNSTLFLKGFVNETINISGFLNETVFTKNFTSFETIEWFVEVCNNASICAQSETRNLTIQGIVEINSTFISSVPGGSSQDFNTYANISSGLSVTTATLVYNSTENAGTVTDLGGNVLFIEKQNLVVPNVAIDTALSFHWDFLLSNSDEVNFSVGQQTVEALQFGVCNSTFSVPFLNFTFADESNLSTISSTVQASSFQYYIGDASDNKTFSFQNLTANLNYTLCGTSTTPALNLFYIMDISATGYPQRTFSETLAISNATTNKTLFLLPTAKGLFQTFQTVDSVLNPVTLVDVRISRPLNGSSSTHIASGVTDSGGIAVFFLNPDITHTGLFTKSGFLDTTISFVPITDLRTVIMGTGLASNGTNISLGLSFNVSPQQGSLANDTNYGFTFNVSGNSDITLISMNLTDQGGVQLLFNSSTSQGNLFSILNTTNKTRINGLYVINTPKETITFTRTWFVGNEFEGTYSLKAQGELFEQYGFSDFSRLLIALGFMIGLMIFLSAGRIIVEDESKFLALITMVWIFSVIGWLNNPAVIFNTPLAQFGGQYGIAIVTTIAGVFYILRRVFQ